MKNKKLHYLIETKSPGAEFSVYDICDSKEKVIERLRSTLGRNVARFHDQTFRCVREELSRKLITSPFSYHDAIKS
jgi:hypothetical protein